MKYPDKASFGNLETAIPTVVDALDTFNKFKGPDEAGRNQAAWKATLNRKLPLNGEGLDAVLEELTHVVIPNGLRNGHPGFSGWVTTSPTTSGTIAQLAATVAGSARF